MLGKETEESAAFELDLTSLRWVLQTYKECMLSASHEVGWWNGVVVRKEGWVKKVLIVHILALSDFAARDVFCCPQVAELPACVLSVAGAMRTGKSFLLDQMVSIFLASVLMEWSEIFYFRLPLNPLGFRKTDPQKKPSILQRFTSLMKQFG